MARYDFCLMWNWEHDADFVRCLHDACLDRSVSMMQVTPDNLTGTLLSLYDDRITFQSLFDRASDTDKKFIPVVQWARERGIFRINPREKAQRTWSKSEMHYRLIQAGIYTPYSIIIPSYDEKPVLDPVDLSPLGENFTIKPSHGGGGEGVVLNADSLQQVLEARQDHPGDIYLLQAQIAPSWLEGRRAWFRVICCAGVVYPFWWDTHTHIYGFITDGEESRYRLSPLRDITGTIARVCGLDLFSTEIALTDEGTFVVVDYVNDQIDLRVRSKTPDGVPDEVVRDIAGRLIGLVAPRCSIESDG